MKLSAIAFLLSLTLCGCQSLIPAKTISADAAIQEVDAYGFVDLEGAKVSAIIVKYNTPVEASSVHLNDYQITDYTTLQEKLHGYASTIEQDGDAIKGNEGQLTKVYVNDKPEISATGGTRSGAYVILEVNTAYMLTGQNLSYVNSMIAGVKQVGSVSGLHTVITPSTKAFVNYTTSQQENPWRHQLETIYTADKQKIILPQFAAGSGWTLHRIGDGAFHAVHSYSEYTGKYEDFQLPYSIFVPDQSVLEKNKGHIALVIHMEHAGANDTDPLAALTSSKAAVKLSGRDVQSQHPAIVIVPQIEESRRSTNDFNASSEANTAVWELIDATLKQYQGYIDTNRIYGTGQSMGGMTILNMAAQRDNFFAGIAIVGAQWSNSYNKPFQNNGSPARTPQNDPISFNGFGLDKANYQNWYYMVSDDNILIHSCAGDPMATGEWQALSDYYRAAGVVIPHQQWDPYLPLVQQNANDKALTRHENTTPGSGINWGSFSRGSHMSTWKYGYQLDYPFQWLFAQTRQTEIARGKILQLKHRWLGRDAKGQVRAGSGTAGLNSAQFTPRGASEIYGEGWTPVSATNKLIQHLPALDKITEKDQRDIDAASTAYARLTPVQKRQIHDVKKLRKAEQKLSATEHTKQTGSLDQTKSSI